MNLWCFWKKKFCDKNGKTINSGDFVCYRYGEAERDAAIYLALRECCDRLVCLVKCRYQGCDHTQAWGGFRHINGRIIGGEQHWKTNSDFPARFEIIGTIYGNPELLERLDA